MNIQFIPFSSSAETSFWIRLNEFKLKELKLNEGPIPIKGYYNASSTIPIPSSSSSSPTPTSLPIRLRLDQTSLFSEEESRNELITAKGEIYIYNTIETLKRVNKNQILSSYIDSILKNLNSFLCLCFLDLKKHDVIYWFAFPALLTNISLTLCASASTLDNLCNLHKIQVRDFYLAFHELRKKRLENNLENSCPAYFIFFLQKKKCMELSAYSTLTPEEKQECIFAFVDPTTSQNPGWPMRNLIAFLSLKLNLCQETLDILSFRPKTIRRIYPNQNSSFQEADVEDNSYIYRVIIPDQSAYSTKVIGWEPNLKSKMSPRHVSLQTILSPTHLASQAINLNLSLMKWRLIPSLDTNLLAKVSCLLIGAGTLGCNVARTLIGWGVTQITFLDNGEISHSNPVRQSLFNMCDVGKRKAIAAAEALMKIAPIQAKGVDYSIPMPGHIMENESLVLDDLIQSHQVIFLLTDTRESRWLPTLISTYYKKICINAALGLDSYMIIRQGSCNPMYGCYFCNDVVAPQDSTKERTIDQQCTVTRPGLAPLNAAMAVELMVSLLHHPKQNHASVNESHELGSIIPHQIRGSVHSFQIMTPKTEPAFEFCTACSNIVVQEYGKSKEEFVKKVCCDGGNLYLEELTGLKEFREKNNAEDFDWDEDDDEL